MAQDNFPEMVRDELLKSGEDDAKQIILDWKAKGQHEDLYLDFTTKQDPTRGALDIDDRANCKMFSFSRHH